MSSQVGDLSDDGFWVLTDNGWQPTEKQIQALADGAIPHDQQESTIEIVEIKTVSESGYGVDNPIKSYLIIGLVCLGLVMQTFGMFLDSWTNNSDESEEEWLEQADGGLGLTDFTFDCSDVTGENLTIGVKNKDMCKLVAGIYSGDITNYDLANADTVEELTDELPDEISGSISGLCDYVKDVSDGSGDAVRAVENCESRESAGDTAITLYWISLSVGIIAAISLFVCLFNPFPHSNNVNRFLLTLSTLLSIIALLCWLIITPELDEDISYGFGFAMAIFSILAMTFSCVLSFINNTKPTKTIVV